MNAPNPDFDFTGSWWARQAAGPGESEPRQARLIELVLIEVDDLIYPRIDTSTISK